MQPDYPATILIVDDTPTNLSVLSESLTAEHYQVAVALDGETAIEQIRYKPPELILLDVMMPGIDGFETCKRLKEDPTTRDIPIIFMTALADPVDKVKGLRLGAVDYITKPFQQEEVLARVNVHLQLYRLNQNLEKQVRERTAQLSEALTDLQNAQVQLVQSEKMSSLGQLVAGVAHEINNPVNFIHGNLIHATEYVGDLMELLEAYRTRVQPPIPELEDLAAEIDYDFLKDDLPKLLKSMRVGADRIQGIIKSLRTFSRSDEATFAEANLHESLDSTLLILSNRIKAKSYRPAIQVVKDYGDLPAVECCSGQLNQVFTNILSNAIDAIDERVATAPPDWTPTIRLQTRQRDNCVEIILTNNGQPMPSDVRDRLFDPFFTTKPQHKGTGMGMSISHQIITEKHGGTIACDGNGDEVQFTIELPLRPCPVLSQSRLVSKV